PVGSLIEKWRMVKTPEEIERIRRSVETNSNAFTEAIKTIKPGMTEAELAAEIEYRMRRGGAEKPSFDTIVASGARTALPHAQPGPQRFREHEVVLIDMGATRNGYCSDMTRMAFLGKPDPKTRKMYEAVLEAQLAAIDAVREGTTGGKVDRAARQMLKSKGLDKQFVHSTGHGLGLEIHEPPRLGKKDKTRLEAGMVITIEPGVYIEGSGGVRIEDTVLVTKNGCEVLTPTSKELMVL
ncbi:MAG: M24 family metallopeptidase, partial [Bryobacteraceae bacterium]